MEKIPQWGVRLQNFVVVFNNRMSCKKHVACNPLWKYDVNNQLEDIVTDGSSGLARSSGAQGE